MNIGDMSVPINLSVWAVSGDTGVFRELSTKSLPDYARRLRAVHLEPRARPPGRHACRREERCLGGGCAGPPDHFRAGDARRSGAGGHPMTMGRHPVLVAVVAATLIGCSHAFDEPATPAAATQPTDAAPDAG